MVSDLLLGGDLRYHIQKQTKFTMQDVLVYACEMASVLDYLQSKGIVHRYVDYVKLCLFCSYWLTVFPSIDLYLLSSLSLGLACRRSLLPFVSVHINFVDIIVGCYIHLQF